MRMCFLFSYGQASKSAVSASSVASKSAEASLRSAGLLPTQVYVRSPSSYLTLLPSA